jgi:hypothetical protein
MCQIREVFRLKHEHGFNFRQIGQSIGLGRTAVGEYIRRAKAANLTWPLPEGFDDGAIELFAYSDAKRKVIPTETGQGFRTKAASRTIPAPERH